MLKKILRRFGIEIVPASSLALAVRHEEVLAGIRESLEQISAQIKALIENPVDLENLHILLDSAIIPRYAGTDKLDVLERLQILIDKYNLFLKEKTTRQK